MLKKNGKIYLPIKSNICIRAAVGNQRLARCLGMTRKILATTHVTNNIIHNGGKRSLSMARGNPHVKYSALLQQKVVDLCIRECRR